MVTVLSRLRSSSWVKLLLRVSTTGLLTLSHGGVQLVEELQLPNWDPQPNWKFSFLGMASLYSDNQWIDNILISSSYLITKPFPVEVAVSLNGQQAVTLFSTFHYLHARSEVTNIYPTTGCCLPRLLLGPHLSCVL